MACNDNVIKNIASEISRECQGQNVAIDVDFVTYLVQLLLLNPKYGKLFSRSLSRVNLEYFVKECVTLLTRSEVAITTMKMQHVLETKYDLPQKLIDKHLETITDCLKPLLIEIVETYPDPGDVPAYEKLLRKISIYIILASGLGNPAFITTLKEGMGALESVFTVEDLKSFIVMPRDDKTAQLEQLVAIVSGCRLFNRDCKKGGEGIPDLPFNLADAGTACLHSISNSLLRIMERVNSLTSAIDERITIDEETLNVIVKPPTNSNLTVDVYKNVFCILTFHRQYEVIIRKLLSDVENMVHNGKFYIEQVKKVFEELHGVVRYKAAVPVVQVFPYFASLWHLWRAMQNEMFLISTVNQLMTSLESLQDYVKIPAQTVDRMLAGKTVISDQQRLMKPLSITHRLSLGVLPHYVGYDDSSVMKDRQLQYLGFCAMSLSSGALIPGNPKVGFIKWKGKYYSFSNSSMAVRFGKDPPRYIQEAIEYARTNPCIINLLGLLEDVYKVRNVDCLVVRVEPKTKIDSKEVQTDVHPIAENIVQNYSWNLWEHKRRACQWSNIVNCRTHSTQTDHSHLRSEIQSQTIEMRDKCFQTKKHNWTNVSTPNGCLWGLRGQLNDGQHCMDFTLPKS